MSYWNILSVKGSYRVFMILKIFFKGDKDLYLNYILMFRVLIKNKNELKLYFKYYVIFKFICNILKFLV